MYLVITEYGVICCYRLWYHLSLMWSLIGVISSIVIEPDIICHYGAWSLSSFVVE